MVFFKKEKIAFIHIPKTGGSSVEHATGSFEEPDCGYDIEDEVALQHLTVEKMQQKWEFLEDFTYYAVIRDPVSRFLSEYLWCEAPGLGKKSNQTLDEFIDSVSEIVRSKNYNESIYHDHFIPQKDFLTINGEIIIDHLYLFEDLEICIRDLCLALGKGEIKRIPHAWKSHNKPTATPRQEKRIIEIYRRDQELYQYLKRTQNILFLMTSVVSPLVDQKGIFARDQRFEQSTYTLKSIRKFCPGAKVCWIEGSPLFPKEVEQVKRNSDFYLNFSNSYMSDVLLGFNKTIGECFLLNGALIEMMAKGTWEVFFKISGRYDLNDKFDINTFLIPMKEYNKIIAKQYPSDKWDIGTCYTCLYAVPRSQAVAWAHNMLWINLGTNKYDLLLYESNFMAHYEDDFLHLIDDEIGLNARDWSSYNYEVGMTKL